MNKKLQPRKYTRKKPVDEERAVSGNRLWPASLICKAAILRYYELRTAVRVTIDSIDIRLLEAVIESNRIFEDMNLIHFKKHRSCKVHRMYSFSSMPR